MEGDFGAGVPTPKSEMARVADEHRAREPFDILRGEHLRHDLGADAGDVAEHQPDDRTGIDGHRSDY